MATHYNHEPYLIIGCGRPPFQPGMLPAQPVVVSQDPQIAADVQTHSANEHFCNLAIPQRVGINDNPSQGEVIRQVNPTALFGNWVKNNAFTFAAFRIPTAQTYTIDISAAMNPHLTGNWRGAPAMQEYAAMAGQLDLVYFESLPFVLGDAGLGEATQAQVLTALVNALKPGGVIVLRMQGLSSRLDNLEAWLQGVAAHLRTFPNDDLHVGGNRHYFVFRDTYDYCVDVRVVRL